MSLEEIQGVCDKADMAVCGYAFTKGSDANIQMLQLQYPNHALVLSENGDVLETSMDDVELSIVVGYWQKNHKYMEEQYA